MKKLAIAVLTVGLMFGATACDKKVSEDGAEGNPETTAEAVIDQAVYDRCFSDGLETIEGVPEAERSDAIDEFEKECREEALIKK